jgi:hypothetical protein
MKLLVAACLGMMLAAMAAAGCSKEPAASTESGVTYTNRRAHFTMNLPKGWAATEAETGKVAVIIRAPNNAAGESLANVAVVVNDPPAGGKLEFDAVVAGAKKLVQGLSGYKAISEKSVTLSDGNKAWVQTFESKPNSGGPTIVQRQMIVVANNHSYTVGATTTPEFFAPNEYNFDVCLNSFKVSW